MQFDGFDWDDGNRGKCQMHGVSIKEIESSGLVRTPHIQISNSGFER